MTQKEKLQKAKIMAMTVKRIAEQLQSEARSYDVHFCSSYVSQLLAEANGYLNLK